MSCINGWTGEGEINVSGVSVCCLETGLGKCGLGVDGGFPKGLGTFGSFDLNIGEGEDVTALRLVREGGRSGETNGLQPCRMADGS